MRYSNFHTHCFFCDGKGEPEDYIKKAIELDFSAVGFSSHGPIHIPSRWNMQLERLGDYTTLIKSLKNKYKDILEVYCGLEVDYFDSCFGVENPNIHKIGLDYVIGSVHFMKDEVSGKYLTIDGSEEDYVEIINGFYNGSVMNFVANYYGLIREMVEQYKPDIIGHLDLIKKNNKDNKYFQESENWYRDEVIKTLKCIKQNNCIVEINTGGIARGYMKLPYPSDWILRQCKELDIRLMLNADAHHPENLNTYFTETIDMLKHIGISELFSLKDGKWTPYNVS
jgi:histidinol-phosphatase (PHP family)